MEPETNAAPLLSPADYTDTFSRTLCGRPTITPQELLEGLFAHFPGWVRMLLRLRDGLVKPFGLQRGNFEKRIERMVRYRSAQEIVLGLDDQHLSFQVCLQCTPPDEAKQLIRVVTRIAYHNALGRIYFFFVRPFHRLILYQLLKRV